MRASVLRDSRMIYRDDVPDPVPESGQVLVGVRACGICGSDLHFAAHGAKVVELTEQMTGGADGTGGMGIDLNRDVFMGHEFCAEILEAGPDTKTTRQERWSRRFQCCCLPGASSRSCTATARSVATLNGCCSRHRC